jgi:hypothetical protein
MSNEIFLLLFFSNFDLIGQTIYMRHWLIIDDNVLKTKEQIAGTKTFLSDN